ncbi:MAG: hypothetical protein IT184_09485 [Acidobacteria bacterium]|nr:hypothetical protein [Acidobacteriota bacterium]
MTMAPKRIGLTALLALVSVGAYVGWARLFGTFVFDDTYITYRYAEHWGSGAGLRWNAGEAPVEGFTSAASVALGAAMRRLAGLAPDVTLPASSQVAWVLLLVWVMPVLVRSAASEAGEDRPQVLFGSLVIAGALAVNGLFAFHVFHGLETMVFVAVLLAVVAVVLRPLTTRRALVLAVGSVVTIAVRPDAVALLGPLWLVMAVWTRPPRRALVAGALVAGALLAAITAARWAYFGDVVPNTMHVKVVADGFPGAQYVRTYLGLVWPLILFIALGTLIIGPWRVARDAIAMLLLVPAAVFCLVFTRIDPIMGQGYRFLIVTLPILLVGAARIAVLMQPARSSRLGGTIASGAFVAAVLATTALSNARLRETIYPGWVPYFAAQHDLVALGRRLEPLSRLQPPPLVATADVGALAYFSRLPVLDLIGLNDRVIAREGVTAEYVARRQPDLLVLPDMNLQRPSPDRRLAGEPFEIAGEQWVLDVDSYGPRILADPGRSRSGGGVTLIVARTPGFGEDYEHVGSVPTGTTDTLHVFVRRAYAHAEVVRRVFVPQSTTSVRVN